MMQGIRRAPLLACALLALSAPAAFAAPWAPTAPDDRASVGAPAPAAPACVTPPPQVAYTWVHCYGPGDIADAYGVGALHAAGTLGEGQTIVLVDAYGSPTAAHDLQVFHDTYDAGEPAPDFDQVFPNGRPDYHNTAHGNGLSGPSAAEGWAGEATLDVEWAYAIAPRAHIVLLAVPPAETLGVQGFPNLFKAISDAVDRYPAGTTFSLSLGVSEETFGGAAAEQTARFDAVFRQALAKGDTVFASSGDGGTTGLSKQQKESRSYDHPTVGWPASSPYVTAVGGTQLMKGWTWTPSSDTAFTADGDYNAAYWAFAPGGESEPVWNESWLPAATGGGPSAVYPRPSWQTGVAGRITDAAGNPVDARGVPDLAWNAAVNGGVLVYTSFFPNLDRVGWHIYGGTSAGSPQVAALLALANEQQREAGGSPIGYLNPLLYGSGGDGLRDVAPATYGTALSGQLTSNRLFDYNGDGAPVTPGPVAGHPVLGGWDETTGFGTPQAAAFVAAVRAARNARP